MSRFMQTIVTCCLATCFAVLMTPYQATSEEWGTLKGTFVFEGDAPNRSPLSITKDREVCGAKNLLDESLIVNPENNGIADIVVFLSLNRRQKAPAVHESYQESATSEVRLDNLDCRFEPHVTLLRTGQTLVVGNKDPVGHNTKIDTLKNPAINPIVPAGGEFKQSYKREERLPSKVSCNIHPWMNGWVLVKDLPYFAVTNANGEFQIDHVPTGKWGYQVWHGAGGYVTETKRDGKTEKWKRGRMELEITAGDNDLGTLSVPAGVFK